MATVRENALRQRILDAGQSAFGGEWTPNRWTVAPGRLELLGNHVDYNGGLVLAGAVDRVVMIGVADASESDRLAILAGDVSPRPFTLDSGNIDDWNSDGSDTGPREYALGLLAALAGRDIPHWTSARVAIAGDVPLGFGMSSSAALCVALTLGLADRDLEPADIVSVAREAEHRAGSPVGAMDQSASVAGGVILFDGADASFERLDPDLGEHVFAVADSGVHHALGASAYPERVRESEAALARIRERAMPDVGALGELQPDTWADIRHDNPDLLDPTLTERVDHVVSEVQRVRDGVAAVKAADWERFGALMTRSGRSSATSYNISHPRVEELVGELVAMPGVLGARMMGGGEGGPALALLDRAAVEDVSAALDRGYFSRYPSKDQEHRFQICSFGPGARRL